MNDKITIVNTISEDKIIVNFNSQTNELAINNIELLIDGDIDFNPLIETLITLIEAKKEIDFSFEDTNNLTDSHSKIKLIKETINEIYTQFNKSVLNIDET